MSLCALCIQLVIYSLHRWCNPCKTLTPRIVSAIEEANGAVDLIKVSVLDQEITPIYHTLNIHESLTGER